MSIEITFAGLDDLESIITLWGANRGSLGLMPRDAFRDHILNRWILIAKMDSKTVGYLQFRYTARNQTLAIVHLCVDRNFRGAGIAESLLDRLVKEYRNKALGIKLSCRSDYHHAIKFWIKYNFQPKGRLPSRGADQSIHLVVWWYNFGVQDLFSIERSDKIKAVLDFNIVAKMMHMESSDTAREEIAQLQSDWLVSEVEYYHTSETINEIYRDADEKRKAESRTYIKNYPELNIDKSSVKTVEQQLMDLFPGQSDNDRSDRRQVAETIISGFPYFVTLDEGILKRASRIQLLFQLKIVRPSTLITEIDMSVNAADYNPSKLSGNNFFLSKVTAKETLELDRVFLNHAAGEKKNTFNELLQELTARSKGCIRVIKEDNEIVAVYGYDVYDEHIGVAVIRTKQYTLRQTIFIQNITDLIQEAIEKNKRFVIISDPYLTSIEKDVLINQGFFLTNQGFVRGICGGNYAIADLGTALNNIGLRVAPVKELVKALAEYSPAQHLQALQLEKLLWPMKIVDAEIPCFIIPIKPNFAKELFDSKAAKGELFGARPQLIWNNENVYYRHINPNVESSPARILWYASADRKSPRQMSIVACSYLDEVVTGPAKLLYRKYQRFGIYEWTRDIAKLVKGDSQKLIKVLRFSDSESFKSPISLKRVKKILAGMGESDNNFQSPLRVKNATFMELYQIGTGKKR